MIKKVLLGILGVLVVVVGGVLALASTQPEMFRVERRATMAAPPAAIYENLDDFRRWQEWSPWERRDPNMKKTYDGPQRGVGATYTWSGNDDVGEGRMTVVESRPNQELTIRLEFLKPFPATNSAIFSFKPAASGTEVSWVMEGTHSFMGKVVAVFADMDSMIGKDFEQGLAQLKRVSENSKAQSAAAN